MASYVFDSRQLSKKQTSYRMNGEEDEDAWNNQKVGLQNTAIN